MVDICSNVGNPVPDAGNLEIPADVGVQIAERRKALGWSLETAASKTGVSVSTLSRVENGAGRKLSVVVLVAVCRAYGLSMDALFAIEPAPAAQADVMELGHLREQRDGWTARNEFLRRENETLKAELRRERHKKSVITAAFVVVALLIILWFVLIDGPNGSFGLIRYISAAIDGGSVPVGLPAWWVV